MRWATGHFLCFLTASVLGASSATALELVGVFDGNDFYSEGNDRCTVCDILEDDEAFLLARLEDGENCSTGFEITFDDDKSGTWTPIDVPEDATHLAVKAGPNFALYEITDPDGDIWTTEALRNRGGQQPGLSHLSFYVSPGTVPEPGAGILLLIAAAGLGWSRRRSA